MDTNTIVIAGAAWDFFVAVDRDGTPEDLSTATSIQYALIRGTTVAIAAKSTTGSTSGARLSAGLVATPYTAADTTGLTPGSYFIEVSYTDSASKIRKTQSDTFTVTKGYI